MGQKKKTGVSPKTIKWIWYAAFAPFALVALMLVLTVFGVFGRMPSFEELENPRSNLATEIYSEDGKVIGTFFVQNRSYVQYADLYPSDSTLHIRLAGHEVPPIVAALIATEDVRFRTHSGIDIPSLARVAVKTLLLQNTSQGGGSTITQQLAKNLFPRDTVRNRGAVVRKAKLVTSKFKEWITALKLEYNYTKEEIAAMYLNTVEFGSNAFGIKSAAHTFFNKEPDELNVQEAAVLVGVVNAPTRYSPILNPKNALVRRNLVLSRMEEAGALTTQAARLAGGAADRDSTTSPCRTTRVQATYFREMLRLVMNARPPKRSHFYTEWDYDQAVKEYDEQPALRLVPQEHARPTARPTTSTSDGLKIYTTINSTMQTVRRGGRCSKQIAHGDPAQDGRAVPFDEGALRQNTSSRGARADRAACRSVTRTATARSKRPGRSEKPRSTAAFDKPCPTRVFTYRGERDTILSPRDSILHHKRIMRAAIRRHRTADGPCQGLRRRPQLPLFQVRHGQAGQAADRLDDQTLRLYIRHRPPRSDALHAGAQPAGDDRYEPTARPWSPKEASKVESTTAKCTP